MDTINIHILKIFYISILRPINPSCLNTVTQVVQKVTSHCTTRNSSKTVTSTPVSNAQDATMPLGTAPAPVNLEQTEVDCKQFSVVIHAKEKNICQPQTSHRNKPITGPRKQPDHKTLAQLKKTQSEQENKEDKETVIEDCQVDVDDSSYGDWLIYQGLAIDTSSLDIKPEDNQVENLQGGQSHDNDDIHKKGSSTDDTKPVLQYLSQESWKALGLMTRQYIKKAAVQMTQN